MNKTGVSPSLHQELHQLGRIFGKDFKNVRINAVLTASAQHFPIEQYGIPPTTGADAASTHAHKRFRKTAIDQGLAMEDAGTILKVSSDAVVGTKMAVALIHATSKKECRMSRHPT